MNYGTIKVASLGDVCYKRTSFIIHVTTGENAWNRKYCKDFNETTLSEKKKRKKKHTITPVVTLMAWIYHLFLHWQKQNWTRVLTLSVQYCEQRSFLPYPPHSHFISANNDHKCYSPYQGLSSGTFEHENKIKRLGRCCLLLLCSFIQRIK